MRAFVLILFLACFFGAFGQRVQNLSLFPTDRSVVVKFSIASGPSCSGYTILHSTDSLIYNEAGSEPGICGITAVPEEKSFTHLSPAFGIRNYYKVRLEPYVETSYARSIYLSTGGNSNSMQVYPNPFYITNHDRLTFKFFELSGTRLQGYVYNQSGKPIKNLDFLVISDLSTTSVAGLENGMYMIWLTNGLKVFQCKFIILR